MQRGIVTLKFLSNNDSVKSLRIGLVGGSFNPPHAGHVALSKAAFKNLDLDEVWWVVSLANPLKDPKILAPFTQRLKLSEEFVKPDFIKICDIEAQTQSPLTIDTLKALKDKNPQHEFVWIMGADCLLEFHLWDDYEHIAQLCPIAVAPRSPYTKLMSQAPCLKVLGGFQDKLSFKKLPCLIKIPMRAVSISSTEIRAQTLTPPPQKKLIKKASSTPSDPSLSFACNILEDHKAEDIQVIDLKGKSDFADYMVVATGRSRTHINSLAQIFREQAKKSGISFIGAEGLEAGTWVLVDLGSVIIHIFQDDMRKLYQIEELWQHL